MPVKGRWCYLYRAIDSTGATIDFVLSGLRDAAAAKRLFRKVLTDPSHPQPRVINTESGAPLWLCDFRSEAGKESCAAASDLLAVVAGYGSGAYRAALC